jgi:FkbM family methyltransferase
MMTKAKHLLPFLWDKLNQWRFVIIGGCIFVPLPGDSLFQAIRRGTPFEANELRFIREFLQPGNVFWDIGANFGLHTNLAARKVGRKGCVLAIEPDPRNRLPLRLNVLLNCQGQIRILPLALGESKKQVEFVSCSQGAYSGLKVADVPGSLKKIKVQQSTLDLIAAEQGWRSVDFLKMDAEGAELLILNGGTEFFSSRPRPVLICEFSDQRTVAFGYQARQIYEWLANRQYLWFSLLGNGKIIAQPPKNVYEYDNLIACPVEKLNRLDAWIQ